MWSVSRTFVCAFIKSTWFWKLSSFSSKLSKLYRIHHELEKVAETPMLVLRLTKTVSKKSLSFNKTHQLLAESFRPLHILHMSSQANQHSSNRSVVVVL